MKLQDIEQEIILLHQYQADAYTDPTEVAWPDGKDWDMAKALAMMQEDPRFRELLQKYGQNLTHSVVQEQNKLVGRIGVTPAAAKN